MTATVTVRACAVVMLDEDGLTDTVGVVFAGVVTVTEFEPAALL
jgi:intracellular sulfur oxidation DsrE/DsrF family protein